MKLKDRVAIVTGAAGGIGKGVAQVYVAPAEWKKAGWEAPRRLGAFAKADLKPGQSKRIELTIDPRLLAIYEAAGNNWHIRGGEYDLWIGQSSARPMQSVRLTLQDSSWSASNVETKPSTPPQPSGR